MPRTVAMRGSLTGGGGIGVGRGGGQGTYDSVPRRVPMCADAPVPLIYKHVAMDGRHMGSSSVVVVVVGVGAWGSL